MSAFWAQMRIDENEGTIFDQDRRYLAMRPDVLMGMLHELPAGTRAEVLAALAESARKNGGKSVAAYLAAVGPAQLQQSVVGGAAALGWGSWTIQHQAGRAELLVRNSPFADGHGPANAPLCAPIMGIFHSLAQALMDGPVHVTEVACVACGAPACHFVARQGDTPD